MSLKRRMKRKHARTRPAAGFSFGMAVWFVIAFLVFAGGAMFHACAHRAALRSRLGEAGMQRGVHASQPIGDGPDRAVRIGMHDPED